MRFFASLYGLRPAPARAGGLGPDFRAPVIARRSGETYGMKRRLNLAAVVVHDPELILLDEPTVGVDPSRAT